MQTRMPNQATAQTNFLSWKYGWETGQANPFCIFLEGPTSGSHIASYTHSSAAYQLVWPRGFDDCVELMWMLKDLPL